MNQVKFFFLQINPLTLISLFGHFYTTYAWNCSQYLDTDVEVETAFYLGLNWHLNIVHNVRQLVSNHSNKWHFWRSSEPVGAATSNSFDKED